MGSLGTRSVVVRPGIALGLDVATKLPRMPYWPPRRYPITVGLTYCPKNSEYSIRRGSPPSTSRRHMVQNIVWRAHHLTFRRPRSLPQIESPRTHPTIYNSLTTFRRLWHFKFHISVVYEDDYSAEQSAPFGWLVPASAS